MILDTNNNYKNKKLYKLYKSNKLQNIVYTNFFGLNVPEVYLDENLSETDKNQSCK